MTTKRASSAANSKKSVKSPTREPRQKGRPGPTDKYRTLILFGVDADKKARAAWFKGDELGLLVKAADTMDLIM